MTLKELLNVEHIHNVSGRQIADALEDNDFTDLDSDGLRENILGLLADAGYAISDPSDDSGIGAGLSESIYALYDLEGMKLLATSFAWGTTSFELGDLSAILDYDKAVPQMAKTIELSELRFGNETMWASLR